MEDALTDEINDALSGAQLVPASREDEVKAELDLLAVQPVLNLSAPFSDGGV